MNKDPETVLVKFFTGLRIPQAGERTVLGPEEMKKAAAEEAVNRFVRDGMALGLGTGSTAYYAIRKIGEMVSAGCDFICVATSVQSENLARSLGIKTAELDEVGSLDVTIDGADEIDPDLQLIKGLGGALLREKIVAAATVKEVIVADGGKAVEKLGTKVPLPVEVLKFGHEHTARALRRFGCEPVLRMSGSDPFVTDGGNLIYDCRFGGIDRPFYLEMALDSVPGVVENGLFLNTACEAVVCDSGGAVRFMSEGVRGKREQDEIRMI